MEPESSSRDPAESPSAVQGRLGSRIHRRREADRADDDAVAGVAAERQEDHRDPADDDDGEPGALLQSHARYFGVVASVDAPTLTDAGGAVEYLQEISPEMRGCAILSADGEVLAASGDRRANGARRAAT